MPCRAIYIGAKMGPEARLTIATVCYPTLGGSGVIAVELAAGLARRGHQVHVIATAPPSRMASAAAGLSFHEVAAGDYPILDHPPYDLAVASKIVELATTQHVDLVHVHYAVPHSASAYLARQVLGTAAPRIVTTLHGTDVTRLGADPRYRAVTSFTVAASDGVTVPSQFLKNEAHERLGLAGDLPIEVIPNFVDTDHFAPAELVRRSKLAKLFGVTTEEGGPILFHVSNFRPVKRTVDLIETLARLRRQVAARLVLIGDGPQRIRTEQRARELGVDGSVRFLGSLPDFVEHLQHADAFLLTSESESFGVAALEALSCGVPVVAYRVGGLAELVTNGAGVLVQAFDVQALAAAVLDVVRDPQRRMVYGRAARQQALAHFQREPAIDHYESYFQQILKMQPMGPIGPLGPMSHRNRR